ncbi:MAG: hypothetical protein ACEPOZ_21200 [Marinifilaceae bacterium]
MRQKLLLLFLFVGQLCFSQEFRTLHIERKNVDANNKIFRIGNAFVYDYEIIDDGIRYKLNYNEGLPVNKFDLVKAEEDTLGLKIHLLVPRVSESEKTNRKQSEIYYLYEPAFSFMSQTGIVENEDNIWIHPPRSGFFQALETCPYPYIKYPIEIGRKWSDKMKIGDHWCNEKWGVWHKKLLLTYDYKITQKTEIETGVGKAECYVIESTADSDIGQSKLRSFYSEKYGFMRLEYETATGIKVNIWLDSFSEANNFNEMKEVAKYIDVQKRTVSSSRL